ncbi:dihydrolipoyl dehydrogenase [Oscillibacter sp.]|jgi:dihydrolipoamide dehydrogenase|uniref:dihydrolipoyl dehydrogenase n=1 Tax=Oscillibacter sp. TaxID=1945593 RepID=UPI00216EA1EC|nr:dihydrolipoyl dehydrogenase [Oscillibacter sp.]MCI9648131.1 dihydrolipoyl dehydrogenase [Oscillibacter sp.]
MAAEIYMPKNGMDMTEGTLIRWLKEVGDPVTEGEAIMEIETDKVTMEAEAPASGILLQKLYEDGAVVPVLSTLGYIAPPGEELPPAPSPAPAYQSAEHAAAEEPLTYQTAVIGGGPAGYVAAIRAAQLGARVILFEKDTVGGTCLNRGCIPTKALLKTASCLRRIKHAAAHGIRISGAVEADLPSIMANKNRIVQTLTNGVSSLLCSNGVKVVKGDARLISPHQITCCGSLYSAEKIILCGGAAAVRPPIPGADHDRVLTSTELLNLQDLPRSLCVIGGGVIGCELASAFRAFGAEVVIVEQTERLVPAMDPEVSAEVKRAMEEDGITLHLRERVQQIVEQDGQLTVVTDTSQIPCDVVLLSAGRAANLECLGELREQLRTEGGRIVVDDTMKTSIDNIYACGDINGRAMLAHTAFKMGRIAAENCVRGDRSPCHLNAVPSVLYTLPEAASVGLTEPQARERYPSGVLTGRFPLSANGRSVAAGETAGFVKVLADSATGELLGVHIVGDSASEMIAEPAALMAAEVTIHEIASQFIHAHPSCAEAFAEACADALNSCIHLPPKRQKPQQDSLPQTL